MELLDLCYDVLIRVMEGVNAEDLAACSMTCWGLNRFIKENQLLYKAHYLKKFVGKTFDWDGFLSPSQDDPRGRPLDSDLNWEAEIQKLVKCQKIMKSKSIRVKVGKF